MAKHQYFCLNCRYEREGYLDDEDGINGYIWDCPKCKSRHRTFRTASRVVDEPSKDSV